MNAQNATIAPGTKASVFRDAAGYFLVDERKRYISPLFHDEDKLMDWAKQHGVIVTPNSRACNSRNPIVANAMNACGTARNAMGLEEAEQRANQFVSAAKSRIASEAGTLGDTIKLLKQVRGHEDSKKIQDALMTLQWALQEVNKAAQYFK